MGLLSNTFSEFFEGYLPISGQYQNSVISRHVVLVERSQSQAEVRRPAMAFEMRDFEIEARLLQCDELSATLNFFRAMRGPLTGFRWKDTTNYRLTALPTFVSWDGIQGSWTTGRAFQEPEFGALQYRVYQVSGALDSAGNYQFVRKPIFKLASVPNLIDLGTLAPVTPDSVDLDTGVITLSSPVARLGVDVEFDTPVRFLDEELPVSLKSTSGFGDSILSSGLLPNVRTWDGDPLASPLGFLQHSDVTKATLGTLRFTEILPPNTPSGGGGYGGGPSY